MEKPASSDGGAWTMFLLMAFAVVAAVCLFAVHEAGLPMQLAMTRSVALDQVLAVSGQPDAAAKLAALRPDLGDSAGQILSGPGELPARVAAERARMLQAFGTQSQRMGTALSIDVAATIAAAAIFGIAVISVVRRAKN